MLLWAASNRRNWLVHVCLVIAWSSKGLLVDINADVLGLLRWKHVKGVPRTSLRSFMSLLNLL